MREKQIITWRKLRRHGYLGFLLKYFLLPILMGNIIVVFLLDLELLGLLPILFGQLTASIVISGIVWRKVESGYKGSNLK